MAVFANSGLGHVCIIVKDMEKSLAFYRDALGMEVAMDVELPRDDILSGPDLDMCTMVQGSVLRLVILFDGKTTLELQEWRHPPVTESPTEHLGYRTTGLKEVDWIVPDLDKLVKGLEEKGFRSRTPIWTFKFQGLIESRQVLYFDPDGVTVQFTEMPQA